MGLLDLFDSGDKKRRLSHVKNLVALAAADGEMDQGELDLIFAVGARVGLKREELVRIISRPESVFFKAPDTFRERIEQLHDMVLVMMIDGEIHENEVALCKFTAIKLGFMPQLIDKMVHEVIEMIAKGLALEVVLSNLEREYA